MNEPLTYKRITETETAREGSQGTLSDGTVELVAATLRVIGDPTRIRLMEILNRQGRVTVSALTAQLGVSQQTVSKQLSILYQAGIVSRRREGAWVHYELIDWTGWWLVEQLGAAFAPA